MIIAFGHQFGVPTADKVFDVRDLSHDMDRKDARDRVNEITAYVKAHPKETIAIGCAKGQHRSVVIAGEVAKQTQNSLYIRDAARWKGSGAALTRALKNS